jgi:sugar phosphate permease
MNAPEHRGRIRWVLIVLTIGAILLGLIPHVPAAALKPLCFYGLFIFGSYPIVEAALMDAVPNAVRRRVFGLFITIGGLIGNLTHWLIGKWVSALGPDTATPGGYAPFYATLTALMLLSLAGLPFRHALRRRENALTTNDTAAAAIPS